VSGSSTPTAKVVWRVLNDAVKKKQWSRRRPDLVRLKGGKVGRERRSLRWESCQSSPCTKGDKLVRGAIDRQREEKKNVALKGGTSGGIPAKSPEARDSSGDAV